MGIKVKATGRKQLVYPSTPELLNPHSFITVVVFLLQFHLKSENLWLLINKERRKYWTVIQCTWSENTNCEWRSDLWLPEEPEYPQVYRSWWHAPQSPEGTGWRSHQATLKANVTVPSLFLERIAQLYIFLDWDEYSQGEFICPDDELNKSGILNYSLTCLFISLQYIWNLVAPGKHLCKLKVVGMNTSPSIFAFQDRWCTSHFNTTFSPVFPLSTVSRQPEIFSPSVNWIHYFDFIKIMTFWYQIGGLQFVRVANWISNNLDMLILQAWKRSFQPSPVWIYMLQREIISLCIQSELISKFLVVELFSCICFTENYPLQLVEQNGI